MKRGTSAKVLAIIGVVLLFFPVVAMLLTSGFRPGPNGESQFMIDYLMPAELFPSALIGAGLLLWASLRARLRRKQVVWGIVVMLVVPLAGTILTVASGLASGATEAVGPIWWAAVALIIIFTLSMIALGIIGILLVRDLFRSSAPSKPYSPTAL